MLLAQPHAGLLLSYWVAVTGAGLTSPSFCYVYYHLCFVELSQPCPVVSVPPLWLQLLELGLLSPLVMMSSTGDGPELSTWPYAWHLVSLVAFYNIIMLLLSSAMNTLWNQALDQCPSAAPFKVLLSHSCTFINIALNISM